MSPQVTRGGASPHVPLHFRRALERLDRCLSAHFAAGHGTPAFAFPPGELAGCLDAHGWLFVRNQAARGFLECALFDLEDADMPTITMLRAVLERRKIEVGVTTWAELERLRAADAAGVS